jgi:hypothetical protein
VDQAAISPLVGDGSMGSLEASRWPLVTYILDRFRALSPLGIAKVDQNLCVSLSWTSRGSMLITSMHSKHIPNMAQHFWGSYSSGTTCSFTKLVL